LKCRSRPQAAPPAQSEYRCEGVPVSAGAAPRELLQKGKTHPSCPQICLAAITLKSRLVNTSKAVCREHWIPWRAIVTPRYRHLHENPVPLPSDDVDSDCRVLRSGHSPGAAAIDQALASGSACAPRNTASAAAVGFPSSSFNISPGNNVNGAPLPFRARTRTRIAGSPARP